MQRRGQDEAHFILHQDVGSAVARSGFGTAVGGQAEAESGAVVVRGLARVADVELDVIGAVERQEILLNGLGMLPDLRHGFSSMRRQKASCLRPCRGKRAGNSAGRKPSADVPPARTKTTSFMSTH